jgi:hypothetical protein
VIRRGFAPIALDDRDRTRTVHVTREIRQRRLLLMPEPARDAAIRDALWRAQAANRLALHGYGFYGHRVELLFTATAPQTTAFLRDLFEDVGAIASQGMRWNGAWKGHATVDVVAGERQIEAFWQVHAAPVEAGWVAHPADWPGVGSARALVGGARGGAIADDFELEPLPIWQELGASRRLELISGIFDGIAAMGRSWRAGAPPMGHEWILARDPTLPDPREPGHAWVLEYDQHFGLR